VEAFYRKMFSIMKTGTEIFMPDQPALPPPTRRRTETNNFNCSERKKKNFPAAVEAQDAPACPSCGWQSRRRDRAHVETVADLVVAAAVEISMCVVAESGEASTDRPRRGTTDGEQYAAPHKAPSEGEIESACLP